MELRSMELLALEDGQHCVRSKRRRPFTQRRNVSPRKTEILSETLLTQFVHSEYKAALQSRS